MGDIDPRLRVYYSPNMERTEAHRLLEANPNMSFIIRRGSGGPKQPYTISYLKKDMKIVHHRILRDSRGFYAQGSDDAYPTLYQLLYEKGFIGADGRASSVQAPRSSSNEYMNTGALVSGRNAAADQVNSYGVMPSSDAPVNTYGITPGTLPPLDGAGGNAYQNIVLNKAPRDANAPTSVSSYGSVALNSSNEYSQIEQMRRSDPASYNALPATASADKAKFGEWLPASKMPSVPVSSTTVGKGADGSSVSTYANVPATLAGGAAAANAGGADAYGSIPSTSVFTKKGAPASALGGVASGRASEAGSEYSSIPQPAQMAVHGYGNINVAGNGANGGYGAVPGQVNSNEVNTYANSSEVSTYGAAGLSPESTQLQGGVNTYGRV